MEDTYDNKMMEAKHGKRKKVHFTGLREVARSFKEVADMANKATMTMDDLDKAIQKMDRTSTYKNNGGTVTMGKYDVKPLKIIYPNGIPMWWLFNYPRIAFLYLDLRFIIGWHLRKLEIL